MKLLNSPLMDIRKAIYLTIILISGSLIASCGEDPNQTPQGKLNEAALKLDKKDYHGVIDILGDCSEFSGEDYELCILDLSAAYFGLAGMNMLSLGQDILQIEADDPDISGEALATEITILLINKISSDYVKQAIEILNQLFARYFEEDARVCTPATYENLRLNLQNACFAQNPLLLQQVLNESNSNTAKSDVSFSLEDLIEYTDIISEIATNIDINDVSNIVTGKEVSDDKDFDGNKSHDSIDFTQCIMEDYVSTQTDSHGCSSNENIQMERLSTNAFSGNNELNDIHSVKLTMTTNENSPSYFLVIASTDRNSTANQTLSVTDGGVRSDAQTPCSPINGTDCFPKPILQDDGPKTFNDSAVELFKNDNSFNAIAVMLADDDTTDEDARKELQIDICGSNGGEPLVGDNGCERDPSDNNKLIIPDTKIIEYFSKTE